MRIICTLTVLFCLATVASSAEKQQPLRSPENVGTLALKKVHTDWRPAEWKIEFNSSRKGYLGMTYGSQKKIVVWIRPSHSSAQVAATIVHELAHVFDLVHMTNQMRAEWLATRGLFANTPWYSCDGCRDDNSGAGDFAESVTWTIQGPGTKFSSGLGPPPNEEQQQLIRRWFSEVAGK
jgi:hypothetical protein